MKVKMDNGEEVEFRLVKGPGKRLPDGSRGDAIGLQARLKDNKTWWWLLLIEADGTFWRPGGVDEDLGINLNDQLSIEPEAGKVKHRQKKQAKAKAKEEEVA